MSLTVPVGLNNEEEAALDSFIAQHPIRYGRSTACRLLIRDSLIGMGILPLPGVNRSKAARRRRL